MKKTETDGCLIPPFEYHVLADARADATSIALHVYGEEMTECNIFEPPGSDGYQQVSRELTDTAAASV